MIEEAGAIALTHITIVSRDAPGLPLTVRPGGAP
jgi:hypothetical protein